MELRHLRYFVAVAEEQSFTRAAERLWIAQPGLSQQIRALECELGVTLFERLSRGVEVTDAGALFLDRTRAVLAAVDEAVAVGRDAGAGIIGNLRLGLGTQARSAVWPAVIAAFSTRRPDVQITVVEAQSDTLVRDLRDARLDAAIVLGPLLLPGMRSALLHESPVHVALSPRHPLACHDRLTAHDLDRQVVAVCGDRDGASYDGFVGGLLDSLEVSHRRSPSGYGPAMLAPVRSGAAIALVPASGVEAESGVTLRPLEPVSTFRFELAWPEGVTSSVVDCFVETCAAALAGRRDRRGTPGVVAADCSLAA